MKNTIINTIDGLENNGTIQRNLIISVLILAILIFSFTSIFIGVSDISIRDFGQWNESEILVLVVSRLPRLAAILLAGIGMSVAGLIMQQITLNKFVSPTTMGTLDATKLGILLSLIIFPNVNVITKSILAFIIALLASFIFLKISAKIKYRSLIFVPLIGIVFGNIINAMATYIAFKYNVVQNMEGWLIGDFSYIIQGNYEIMYLAFPVVIISYLFANKFTIVGLGKDTASSLGINHKGIVFLGITLVSIISTLVIITVGVIPFLGLIIPNIVSLFFGDNLKRTLPYTALSGALFLLIADMISRVLLFPYEIPIGLTVSILGGIIFMFLIFKKVKYVS